MDDTNDHYLQWFQVYRFASRPDLFFSQIYVDFDFANELTS